MKIYNTVPTTNYHANRHNKINNKTVTSPTYNYKPVSYEHIAPQRLNFKSRNLNNLYEEYNWYINHDHTPAINAFLKMEGDEETMDGFYSAILNTEDRGYQLVDSIVRQPRATRDIATSLKDKLGSNSKNVMTFFYDSPYNKAYTNYLEKKYEHAHTLSELLRVRPDWRGSALIEKHKKLKGDEPLEIGSIPKEFPNNHIFQIADYLSEFMEEGIKQKKDIKNLKIDNREYEFKFFTEGKSDKNVFGVFTPEKKKFVLKMAKERYKSLDNPFALGTLAKIDTYLTTNRSRNSAPLCYYNHDRNMSVYKYIEHTPVRGDAYNLNEISEHLPDFKALGLSYHDNIGNKNCFLLDNHSNEDLVHTEGFEEGVKSSEWISVDNDHVTYNNSLQPSVTKFTAPLPVQINF